MTISSSSAHVDVWPLGLLILTVILIVLWRRKSRPARLFCGLVFSIYLLFAIDRAFFPIWITESEAVRDVRFWSAINLIPFKFDLSELPNIVLLQIFQNILLTIPLGFGLSFVMRLRARDFLWLAVATGLGIEAAQLIIGLLLRYPYRIVDINDALLNAIGVLVGYVLFRLFARLYLSIIQRLGVTPTGLAAYLDEVARGAR